MAEEIIEQGGNGIDPGNGGEGAEGAGTDWKALARKWEKRAKDNLAAATELEELKAANRSDLEKANDRAAKAEAKVKEYEAARDRAKWAQEVSEKTGFPASLIQGDTLEDMEDFAKANAHYFDRDSSPVVTSSARKPGKPAATAQDAFTEALEGLI